MESDTSEVNIKYLEKELEDLKNEEQRLVAELSALQSEEKSTLDAIEEHQKEFDRLCGEEHRYWKEYTKHRRELMLTDDEHKRYMISCCLNCVYSCVIIFRAFSGCQNEN